MPWPSKNVFSFLNWLDICSSQTLFVDTGTNLPVGKTLKKWLLFSKTEYKRDLTKWKRADVSHFFDRKKLYYRHDFHFRSCPRLAVSSRREIDWPATIVPTISFVVFFLVYDHYGLCFSPPMRPLTMVTILSGSASKSHRHYVISACLINCGSQRRIIITSQSQRGIP